MNTLTHLSSIALAGVVMLGLFSGLFWLRFDAPIWGAF